VVIEVRGLVKHFSVHARQPGLAASLRGLVHRERRVVRAVDGIDLEIGAGEVVGFLGPNGAGKTTTLKCLSGLLHPTSGTVRVLGHVPHQRERRYLEAITLVLGQRNSLFWDLPAMETFLVNAAIYRIPTGQWRSALDELIALLELEPLLSKQVRALSLGERMRCELAAALLHRPSVLFLDEPTLGLDVHGQAAIRAFLREYNTAYGATVLLTSHYMADVTALARRVIVIDAGVLRFDGDLQRLVETHSPAKRVRVTLPEPLSPAALAAYGEVESADGTVVTLRVPRASTAQVAARLLAELSVLDVAIEEPPVEEIMRAAFRG